MIKETDIEKQKVQNILADRLSTSSSSAKEAMHLNALQYLEEKIEQLDEEDTKQIDDLVDKVHNSANTKIALRDAMDTLTQESKMKDIKLINFLESFYESAPITKSYTQEIHEQNFQNAVLYSFDTYGSEIEALGNIYYNYLDI